MLENIEHVFAIVGALCTILSVVSKMLPEGRAKTVTYELAVNVGNAVNALKGKK
jgi:hypothetical protein